MSIALIVTAVIALIILVVALAIFGKGTGEANHFLNIAATKLAFKLSPKTCSAIYSCKSALEMILSAAFLTARTDLTFFPE